MIGFPLSGATADRCHERAFEYWACAGNALSDGKPVEQVLHLPLDRENFSKLGYRKLAPDIGTSKKKYMVPEIFRESMPETYMVATGQDKMIRQTLRDMLGTQRLRPPPKIEISRALQNKLKEQQGIGMN